MGLAEERGLACQIGLTLFILPYGMEDGWSGQELNVEAIL